MPSPPKPRKYRRRFPPNVKFSASEKVLLLYLIKGHDQKSIALNMGIAEFGVKNRLNAIFDKTGMGTSRELMAYLHEHQIQSILDLHAQEKLALNRRIIELSEALDG